MTVIFTRQGALKGAYDILPLTIGALLFGMVFGLLAAKAGLSLSEAALMSGLVFAGASQFAAMQSWSDPVPVFTMILTTFAVNARHLVMGVVLAPWLRPIGRIRALVSLHFMVDESWGLSAANMKRGGADAAYLVGGGATLFVIWLIGTIAGRISGGLVPDPKHWALDFLPLSLFLALLMGFWQGPLSLAPWLSAAAVAYGADAMVGPGWPVLLGALAGAATGALIDTQRRKLTA